MVDMVTRPENQSIPGFRSSGHLLSLLLLRLSLLATLQAMLVLYGFVKKPYLPWQVRGAVSFGLSVIPSSTLPGTVLRKILIGPWANQRLTIKPQ